MRSKPSVSLEPTLTRSLEVGVKSRAKTLGALSTEAKIETEPND
jgi:hypothetical protein